MVPPSITALIGPIESNFGSVALSTLLKAEFSRPKSDCQLMWCCWCCRIFWFVFNSLHYELKTSQSQADTLYGNPPGALNSAYSWSLIANPPSFRVQNTIIIILPEFLLSPLRASFICCRPCFASVSFSFSTPTAAAPFNPLPPEWQFNTQGNFLGMF